MECEPTFPWPSCEQPAVSSNWLPDAAKWPVKHGPHLYGAYYSGVTLSRFPPVALYKSHIAGRASSCAIGARMADARTDTLTLSAPTVSLQATTLQVEVRRRITAAPCSPAGTPMSSCRGKSGGADGG
jgi:hypothetical protein